jgi:CcmD family protein
MYRLRRFRRLFLRLAGPHPRSLCGGLRPHTSDGLVALLVIVIWLAPTVLFAQPPASPTPAQEGFVPFDQARAAQEQLPAAPLVLAAYAVAWMVVFGYVWSLWQRLARVEREIVDVGRRVTGRAGGGRT